MLLPLTVVMAVGGAMALLTLELARRTAEAYPRYVEGAEVGDVEINPSLFTAEIDKAIRSLPGLDRVTTSDLFLALIGYDSAAPIRYSQLPTDSDYGVFGSADGRHESMDRLALQDGEAATGPNEAVINAILADDLGLSIGDEVPISFWRTVDDLAGLAGEDPLITPVGVERVTIVGIATFPREVLGDELWPVGRMVVSADVAARYECTIREPPLEVSAEEALLATAPPDCATAYRYWSILVDGGVAEAEALQESFVKVVGDRNAGLAPALAEQARYLLITSTLDADVRDVRRSVQPTVTAFSLLALTAAIATLGVLLIVSVRVLRESDDERETWRQVGLGRPASALAEAVPMLIALVIGVTAAAVAAWTMSTLGPVGNVRSVALPVSRSLDPLVWAGGALLFVVAAVVVIGLAVRLSMQVERPRLQGSGSSTIRSSAFAPMRPPEVAEGLRAALATPRDTGFTVGLGTIAVSALVAALTFGASLSTLLETPARYGWPWDGAAMVGAGYNSATDVETVGRRLDEVGEITSWAGLGFWQSIVIDGVAVPTIVGFGAPSKLDLTLTAGRLPADADEIAIGTQIASSRGIRVGDTVTIEGELALIDEATVTGVVVLPSVGPLQSDRASPGRGVLVRADALQSDPFQLLTFIGFDLTDDADPQTVLDELGDDLSTWDPSSSTPRLLPDPVRPAPIVSVQEIRTVPFIVAALLGGAATIGLTAALYATVRARGRTTGILRALGFTIGQVKRMVAVQSLAIAVVSLVFGVPVGIAIGRLAWQAHANQLGVVTQPTTPWRGLAVLIGGTVLVALVAAIGPGSRAAQRGPHHLLVRQ
jgi:hypothetical protein